MDLKLMNTAQTYLQVFKTLDVEPLKSILSDVYKHDFAPASLGMPSFRDRESYMAHIVNIRSILSSFPVTPKQIWTDPMSNRVTIWADSSAHFHHHVKDNDNDEEWTFYGEYIFILEMDSSGEKVDRVVEFLDSKGTERVLGLFKRARKRLEEAKTE